MLQLFQNVLTFMFSGVPGLENALGGSIDTLTNGGLTKVINGTGQAAIGGLTTIVEAMFIQFARFLPNGGTLPATVHAGAVYFGEALARVNFIFPVYDILDILLIVISIRLTLFAWHLVYITFNYLRGIPTYY